MSVTPWKHQVEGSDRAKVLPWFAFLFEPGTGKTFTTITTLRFIFNSKRKILRTLIFGPPIVIQNWKDEWHKYSSIQDHLVVKLEGSGEKRLKTFLENAYKPDPMTGDMVATGCVFITNYEALLMPKLYQAMLAWQPEAIVNDEAHRVRSHDAKRSEALNDLCNPIDKKLKCISLRKPLVYNLTGTPRLKDDRDLFMQYKIMLGGFPTPGFYETYAVDPIGAQGYLIKNFYTFQARYFYDANASWKGEQGYFPEWKIKPGAKEEIAQLIAYCSMSVRKEDCLDLPPEVIVPIKVDMLPEQKRNYAELKKHFVTSVQGERVTADLAMVKALRLLQITSGFISPDQAQGAEDDPVQVSYAKTPKREALKQLLEDITPNHKILVWAVWKENYKQLRELCEELKVKYVEVHGEISKKQKDENVKAFQTDPEIKVFIGHPGSGGIGINLVQAPYSAFYSRTFKLEEWLQARARNHRGGSKEQGWERITHYDICCEGTIDELATLNRDEKSEGAEQLLTMLRNNLEKI